MAPGSSFQRSLNSHDALGKKKTIDTHALHMWERPSGAKEHRQAAGQDSGEV